MALHVSTISQPDAIPCFFHALHRRHRKACIKDDGVMHDVIDFADFVISILQCLDDRWKIIENTGISVLLLRAFGTEYNMKHLDAWSR